MPDYDIPLSSVYGDGDGKRVLIEGGRVMVIDRTGQTPHDLVSLSDSEAEELAHVLLAYLNRTNAGELGGSRTGAAFDDYRVD